MSIHKTAVWKHFPFFFLFAGALATPVFPYTILFYFTISFWFQTTYIGTWIFQVTLTYSAIVMYRFNCQLENNSQYSFRYMARAHVVIAPTNQWRVTIQFFRHHCPKFSRNDVTTLQINSMWSVLVLEGFVVTVTPEPFLRGSTVSELRFAIFIVRWHWRDDHWGRENPSSCGLTFSFLDQQ